MSKLRRALTEPPPPLPVAGRTIAGSRRSGSAPSAPPLENETAHLSEIAPTVEPELQPLDERGRAYLVQHRHLAPETVDASAHNLRQNRYGSVRALHHRQSGDGEERGENWKSFIGNQADGEGRGRSLWICFPTRGCSRLIVAESFVSALSAWELLSVEERMVTGLVSTTDAISSAGVARLGRLLVGMREHHAREQTGEPIWLYDASDQGEARTAVRTKLLAEIAEQAEINYWRYQPPAQGWNDALAEAKNQAPYRDAYSENDVVDPEFASDQQVQEPPPTRRRSGRGR